jgi:hypothetical protein
MQAIFIYIILNYVGVSIAMSYGWTAWFRFLAGQGFSLLHSIQTSSGAHLASCLMGTGGNFRGGKAARA